jgi:hypothetical protein
LQLGSPGDAAKLRRNFPGSEPVGFTEAAQKCPSSTRTNHQRRPAAPATRSWLHGFEHLIAYSRHADRRSRKDSGAQNAHIAVFRGVGNAAEIRSAVRERVRRYRDTGLGDPDDTAPDGEEASILGAGELLSAARELAREARLLRLATAARIPLS